MSGRFVKSSWASDDVVESGELTSELRASFLKLKSNFLGGEKACNIYRGKEHVSLSGSPSTLGALYWAWGLLLSQDSKGNVGSCFFVKQVG